MTNRSYLKIRRGHGSSFQGLLRKISIPNRWKRVAQIQWEMPPSWRVDLTLKVQSRQSPEQEHITAAQVAASNSPRVVLSTARHYHEDTDIRLRPGQVWMVDGEVKEL